MAKQVENKYWIKQRAVIKATGTIVADVVNEAGTEYRVCLPSNGRTSCTCPARGLCSGSLEQDGSLSIIAVKKEEQTGLVHDLGLGKGQRQVHKTCKALAQRVLPALT